MEICALPLESVPEPRLVLPLLSVTEPVGVPLLALTVIVTVVLWAVVMLDGFAVTVTVGVVDDGPVPILPPPPQAAMKRLTAILNQIALCRRASYLILSILLLGRHLAPEFFPAVQPAIAFSRQGMVSPWGKTGSAFPAPLHSGSGNLETPVQWIVHRFGNV